MNKKVIVYGLVGITLITSMLPTYAASEVEEKTIEFIKEKEIKNLSLEEAVEYGLQNSRDMEIQKLELEKSKILYDQNIKSIKGVEKALDISILVPRTYEVTADDNVNRALVEFGVTRRSIELAYQMAKWNKEMKENQIKYNVEKAYFDLLQIEKELEIAEENLNLSKKQYDHGKLKYDMGTISQQQLLGLDMSLSQAQTAYDSTEIYYKLQLMNFQNILGLSFDQQIALTDKIEYKEYEAIDLAESIKQALNNNVGLKAAQESYELAQLTLKAVKVRFPENTYRYKEQEVEVQKSARNLETAKNGVEIGVRSAYLNLLTAEKQIKTYEKSIEQAEKGVKLAEVSFDLGQNTFTEVMQANINLMNVKKNLSKQIHAYNMALLDYEYSIGIGKGLGGGM